MPLTEEDIRACSDDEALFTLLSTELQTRLPMGRGDDINAFAGAIRRLPRGLRAMAATYELDVSLARDDLGWHFANWHHRALSHETLSGLRELEAHQAARIFEQAYASVQPYWDKIGERLDARGEFDDFVQWYNGSALKDIMTRLTEQFCKLIEEPDGKSGDLFKYWLSYARKYPRRVTGKV